MAAYQWNSKGASPLSSRVLGRYALVYVLNGEGTYRDARRRSQRIGPGDLILVLPELAHWYGPSRGVVWDEFYVIFEGPIFDLWRKAGLFDESTPVHHIEPIGDWKLRLTSIFSGMPTDGTADQTGPVTRFLTFLADAFNHRPLLNRQVVITPAMNLAQQYLEGDLHLTIRPADVASKVGLPYSTFRRQFLQHFGLCPSQFRQLCRIRTSCTLLEHSDISQSEIADSLGFSDQFVYSKLFKRMIGVSPREYRKQRRIDTLA
jgi:AraC-like DNA-binding protein